MPNIVGIVMEGAWLYKTIATVADFSNAALIAIAFARSMHIIFHCRHVLIKHS